MNDPGPKIRAAFLFHEPRAELFRHIGDSVFIHLLQNRAVDGWGLAFDGEGSQSCFWILGRERLDRAEALGQGLSDFFGVTRSPDTGAVNAASTAIGVDAV